MKSKYLSIFLLALVLIVFMAISCSTPNNKVVEQYSVVISDELNPTGLLPECMELTSEGKLIFRTSRFNTDGSLYQKNFFVELNQNQTDSVTRLLKIISDQELKAFDSMPIGTITYKVNIDWMINGKSSNHMLIGNDFPPPLNELITYCQSIPLQNHHFKMKGAHYFSTDEICSGAKRK